MGDLLDLLEAGAAEADGDGYAFVGHAIECRTIRRRKTGDYMPDGPVGVATEAELTALDALGSVEGQIALRLAEQLDAPRNGMAVAADARELRMVMGLIRDGSKTEGDSVDDSRDEAARILRSVG